MLSNLEQHFTVESLHHEIPPAEDDDVSSSSSDDSGLEDGILTQASAEVPWTEEEDETLQDLAESMEPKNWTAIAESLPGRTNRDCKRRWGQLQRSGDGRARTPWTKEEDEQLKELVAVHGSKAWKLISSMMPGRKSKQCRERWTNVVDPKLNYAPWTEEEEQILILAQQELGNKWSQIEKRLPGRSANSIKNYWYSALRRGERKRAKMERKALQPEGKKRRPRKPKTTEGEELPVLAEVVADGAVAEGDEKPKKKGTKRKKKDDAAEEVATDGVKDAALAVDDAVPASATADEAEKPAKKAKKTKEPKSKAPKEPKESAADGESASAAVPAENGSETAPEEPKKSSKGKKATKTDGESPVDIATLSSAASGDDESNGNGKSGKRKATKPTEEEKLLKPAGKKRRKNIAIVDENLSS